MVAAGGGDVTIQEKFRNVFLRVLTAIAIAVGVCCLGIASRAAAAGPISSRGPAAVVTYGSNSATKLNLKLPSGAKTGDVLIATLGIGRTGATSQPVITAPSGWQPAVRTDQGTVGTVAVYSHILLAGENTFTFKTTVGVGGVASVAAFTGVDPARPIDAVAGRAVTSPGSAIATPAVVTSAGGTMLLAAFAGFNSAAKKTTWSVPSGMTEVADAVNATRSGAVDIATQASAGPTGEKFVTASIAQDYTIAVLLALRPPETMTGPVSLIVDTDLFSDADDAGAVATAFALQRTGEARVLAVTLNTRISRPAVAADSWRCVAALARFYGYGQVPIGSSRPINGTETNSPDWAGPCGSLAGPVPEPDDAVATFRRVLAGEPDGSVVIASAGYLRNLADLLGSAPDASSPLTGSDLVAKKVRLLVAMAGGYPSRSGETNIVGDIPAARTVATDWPTRIEWDGYEVGDAVHTGSGVSTSHPPNSPLRVAYEAFVGPRNWIYSYDLTAVYRAVRPNDAVMSAVGPGTNTIDSDGANTFVLGAAGNQYYLRLANADGVGAAIDQLLNAVPPGAGPSDDFESGTIGPNWLVSENGSVVTVAGGHLDLIHPGGPWTTGSIQSATPYSQLGRAVQVDVLRASNAGAGGSVYGETSVIIRQDATHYAEFFIAGGSLTAWYAAGSGATNLTPQWPTYNATSQHSLRFRESAGRLFWEYAASPAGPWTTLASTPNPFPLTTVQLQLAAGGNQPTNDTTQFDNVTTS
jgi:purine nucleosidase